MDKKDVLLTCVGVAIKSNNFVNNHKEKPSDFTRNRILDFPVIFMLVLKKSIKSLQLILNELFIQNHISSTVSSSAYSQARKKFRHTAFIELNESAVSIYYSDNKIKRWNGYRVLGIDGSKIILPNTEEMRHEFGEIKIRNQQNKPMAESYASALFECCYDVLNHIAIQSSLVEGAGSELALATQMLKKQIVPQGSQEKDLLIYDRAYGSYEFLANLIHYKKDFVIRCKTNSFKSATKSLFAGYGTWSKTVQLKAPTDKRKELENQGLSTEITVRFVSVVLNTGEIEVLITSLLDPSIKRAEFKALYFLRWGVEGFFSLIKGRLNLENFTGKSVESVKQDFWSTIFITNVETIFTEETEQDINKHLSEDCLPKKINKAVSFNAIKNMAFDIFFNKNNRTDTAEKLTEIFKTNMVVQRIDRTAPRDEISVRKSYNFQRRNKKYVY
jgi:hypothetical protein